jgi:hypothetical protein
MLMEADLPDDAYALLALEEDHTLTDLTDAKSEADARIEQLQARDCQRLAMLLGHEVHRVPEQAPAPARIVEGGIPTEALIAQVLVSKYADHLPLYRQAQIYARQGIRA